MNDDLRQAIALFRHQIISPVLVEGGRVQAKYFREVGARDFQVPGQGMKRFSPHTLKSWLMAYRQHGYQGLLPKVRGDRGTLRRIDDESAKKIVDLRKDLMELSVAKFYRRAKKAELLGDPPMCEETLRRFLTSNNLIVSTDPATPRRLYEMSRFGELWVADFMHGPVLQSGSRKRKAILLAMIDDYSRLIVGARWDQMETTLSIEEVFKEAVLKYGKPDRLYTDNGPSFSSEYLRMACAQLGIGLVHSKPYDSPSRGKIERFFRTVRESFLIDFTGESLKEINESFQVWLRDEYHHRNHNGIDCRPLDRYQRSIMDFPRPRVNEDALEEFFLVRVMRLVKKDATIAFKSIIYEAPAKYIGSTVELRFRQDRPRDVFLYENNQRIIQIKAVDARANGRSYKPRVRDTVIPYQEKK